MTTICLTAKDAWRQLHAEHATSISYQGFCRWLKKLGIDPRSGIDLDALRTIRRYASVRSSNPCRTHQNGSEKLAALKAIAELPIVSDGFKSGFYGRQVKEVIELHRALGSATIYRRSKAVWGETFSTNSIYTMPEIRKLIFGV